MFVPTPPRRQIPLASTNFLHVLDKATQEIFTIVQAALPSAMPGDRVVVPKVSLPVVLARKPTVAELSRLRRQFLKLAKTHPGDDASGAGEMFVKFLNQHLS